MADPIDTDAVDQAMTARLRSTVGVSDDYPADMLPWPQIDDDSGPRNAERRSAGFRAWRNAEAEVDRLRAENAVALSLLRKFAFPFNPDDPDSGWSFGGYTDKAENVAFLARLEADRG